MNHECAIGDNNLKKYLFYNQVRVNVAVAIVLLRKAEGNRTSREAFISQIQSEVIKYWSEKQPKDGFKNKIIANLQERCVKDVINVLPGSDNIQDTKVNDLIYIVKKSIGIDNAVSQRSDSDLEDGEETARDCEFLRLVTGLKTIVETKTPINFDKGAFKFASDCDDSGVDCDRTSSTLNCTSIFSTSIVSVPSVKFRSITHSCDTDAALKVTLQKLFDFVQKTILKSAESSCNRWKDSAADLSVATIKTLTKDKVLVDTVSEFVSKMFMSIWNNQQSVEITQLQYQTFIFSKLLCHFTICTRLIEDLVLCLTPWCASVEKIIKNVDCLEFHSFISNGPLLLDLITLIIKKWYYYLKHDSNENNLKDDINLTKSIKDLWKAKWDLDEKTEVENEVARYNDYIRSLRRRIIKFIRRISVDFPLLCPQIYVIIEVLDNCKTVINKKVS